MKAFLLAAGHGTRLRPLTDAIPKCLVPIRGVPLLEIWLEVCRRAGITQVLVNLHAHADAVRDMLLQSDNGIHVRLIEEPTLLGSAGTLLANRAWVASEPSFWVLYADVLTNADLRKMVAFHGGHSGIVTMGAYQVDDPGRCGIVTFDADQVVRGFEEKPAHPQSNWAFSGLMIARPAMLEAIPQRVPADLGFDVFPRLLGRMSVYPISDYLLDIGTLETYQQAQATWPGFQSQRQE
jgi:mannose-1-phosphate guanylyltransferase